MKRVDHHHTDFEIETLASFNRQPIFYYRVNMIITCIYLFQQTTHILSTSNTMSLSQHPSTPSPPSSSTAYVGRNSDCSTDSISEVHGFGIWRVWHLPWSVCCKYEDSPHQRINYKRYMITNLRLSLYQQC
jgi:hypothetical protein